jgi:pimeloyl-ACP methyl ester carboxylesterase
MPSFYSDGIHFNYAIRGQGSHTFFFQHGIGGAIAQPFRFLIPEDDHESGRQATPFRLAAFDFRAHGGTAVGDPKKLRIDRFADDLIVFMDHLGTDIAVLGGISMGAAVALSAAARYPERCLGLVLSRPAWLNGSMSTTAVAAYSEAARLLEDTSSPESALHQLQMSGIYRALAAVSADAGKSLLGQVRCVVSDPSLRETAIARLRFLPVGQPGLDLISASTINVPTLIMATPNDPIHPVSFAEAFAGAIPHASLAKLTPKELNDAPHVEEVNSQIVRFLDFLLTLKQ